MTFVAIGALRVKRYIVKKTTFKSCSVLSVLSVYQLATTGTDHVTKYFLVQLDLTV